MAPTDPAVEDIDILIISPDPALTELLTLICSSFLVVTARDATAADLARTRARLVLLHLPGEAGGWSLPAPPPSTQVLVLGASGDLQAHNQAFHWGAADYISLPFDVLGLGRKVRLLLGEQVVRADLLRDLRAQEAYVAVVQEDLELRTVVSGFLQDLYRYHDTTALLQLFLVRVAPLAERAVVCLAQDPGPATLLATAGPVTPIEASILALPPAPARIQWFGHDRALFEWGTLRLLASGVGHRADAVALMLNGLERALGLAARDAALLGAIHAHSRANEALRGEFAGLIRGMKGELVHTVARLSLMAALPQDDRDSIADVVDRYADAFEERLALTREHDFEIERLVMRLQEAEEAPSAGAVELF